MQWVLLVHVMAGATLFGGQFYVESLTAAARRTADPETIMTVGRKVGHTSSRLFIPAGIVVLLTGTWIVLESVYAFETMFVLIGFALTVIALANSMFILNPKLEEVEELIAEKGMTDPDALVKAKSLGNLGHLQTVLVTIIIVVMVLKPGV